MSLPERKSPRMKGYDYSNKNFYYVTICTHDKLRLFDDNGELSDIGKIAEYELLNIPSHFTCVKIDKYVVMPHHMHAIIVIGDYDDKSRPSLSTVIGLYKSGVSKRVHEFLPDIQIWQKSFYDRIIRNEHGYQIVWQYIENNLKKSSAEKLLNDDLLNDDLFNGGTL